MSDSISRQAAIDALCAVCGKACDKSEFVYNAPQDEQVILCPEHYCLCTLPSADRPQGEWIRTGRTNIYGGIEVQCSNCGDKVMVQHLEDEWYCRHCGADMGMKGADDE